MPYGNLADWRAYALARGNDAPTTATDEDAGAALERASDYIRTRYVLRMAVGTDTTDERIVEATYIAAGLELATPGFWSRTYTPSQAKVLTRVGEIAWTPLPGVGTGVDAFLPTSPAIEALLRDLLWWCGPAMMVI